MPIYMDRHDVSETVTAENVAELHQADLKIQKRFGCTGLTYWFDEKRKTAFCLIEAPNKKAIQKMHNHAHGQVANSIIEVSTGIVESFLGRIQDPEKTDDTVLNIINDPAFRTIMVIRLKQSTLLPNSSSGLKTFLQNFNHQAIKLLQHHEGTSVKQTKNYWLVSFKLVSNAVSAAYKIQLLFKHLKKDIKDGKLTLKIGLSAGVPVTDKKSFFEDTIKLAERMNEFIKGEIIVSSEVKELYDAENPVALSEAGNIISLSRSDENFLTLLMDYTESVWRDSNLRVDDFSKPVMCSKSQLYRKMMRLTGKSPNTFIREYRLNEALLLLDKNAGNISDISFETGFSSPSYFSKCFQKRYSVMPSDYSLSKVI
ncbi:MAG: nickel-binding protein [Ginsengibacter sp.]